MKLRGRRFHQLIAGASILAACSSTPEGAAPDAVPSTASSTALATIRSAPTSPATDGPTTTSVAVPALPATPVQCRAVAVSDSEPTLADPQLNELSGLAVGRLDSSILWAVDDDADPPAVHGLAADGTTISRIELHGVTGGDWEDLAAGPGPDGDPTPHLYVADIGDNKGQRDNIRVFRFPEPGPASTGVAPDTITLTYPDGPRDAESLAVDPLTGDLLMVSKERVLGPLGVYRAPAPSAGDSTVTLEKVHELDVIGLRSATPLPLALGTIALGGFFPTALDISADGTVVALRTYEAVWLFARSPQRPAWTAFEGKPCEGASAVENQGEALALTTSGYITVSEGPNPPLNRFEPAD